MSRRLLAVCVSLLAPKGQANIDVLYHIYHQKSSEIDHDFSERIRELVIRY